MVTKNVLSNKSQTNYPTAVYQSCYVGSRLFVTKSCKEWTVPSAFRVISPTLTAAGSLRLVSDGTR